MFLQFQLTFSIFYVLVAISRSELSCRNENNQFVDWFVALKPPNEKWFLYFSSQSEDAKWKRSKNINNNLNIFSVTLKQAYDSKSTGSFLALYNDQNPYSNRRPKGHVKGIINFDKTSGYWIIHSVPRFPLADQYEYPKSGIKNGQSFICVSLKIDNLEEIVDQLLMMQPGVYHSNLPDEFSSNNQLMTKLKNLISNKLIKMRDSKILSFLTINQFKLFHFGKSYLFNKDLYSRFIATNLKSPIIVETWKRKNKLPSYCDPPYKVYNLLKFKLDGEIYKYTQDHSKWVVSASETERFVCIGDINRSTSQFKRGGGSLCVYHDKLWSLFHELVVEYEDCTKMSNNFEEFYNYKIVNFDGAISSY
nr:deoxyribonuclease 2-4 [Dugesia japonica]